MAQARRRKHGRAAAAEPPAGQDAVALNTPFRDAAARLAAKIPPPSRPATTKVGERRAAGEPQAVSPAGPEPSRSEVDEFIDQMAGVVPLAGDRDRRVPASTAPAARRAHHDSEAEAYAELADLVLGQGPFDIADSDEFVEGIAPGLDRRLLRRLRNGDYAVQAHLDLHGLDSEAAKQAVAVFLTHSRSIGHRCVLLVHGRGHGSRDQIPVLKQRVLGWLSRGRLSRLVLAFSTARPYDGGAGALYLLLRRPGRSAPLAGR
jgi:DNA-nicking Smr family endonuclease